MYVGNVEGKNGKECLTQSEITRYWMVDSENIY